MFAYFALFSWPVVVFILFARLKATDALIWSILGGYLLLPVRTLYNPPILPTLDKSSVPAIAAMLAVAVWLGQQSKAVRTGAQGNGAQTFQGSVILPGWLPGSTIMRILLLVLILGTFATVLNNSVPQIYGPKISRGLRPFDAFSDTLTALTMLLPFFLGRKILAHPDAHKDILRIVCLAGLAYSLLALLEVRISPQLSKMLYGYHPGGWLQNLRGGGYRPTVFLAHGLFVGLFFSTAVLCALGYKRLGYKRYLWAMLWLLMTLVLVKSLGALIIALLLMPLVLIATPRMQMLVSSIITICFLSYPVLRTSGWVPVDALVSFAAKIDDRRAGSLSFRFENEDILLERAAQKPVFGWGGWSRSRVFDEKGRDISITDGTWIIKLGVGGWVKYITEFGLLTLSVLLLTFRKRRYEVALSTSLLCVVLAGNLIDLIPNSGLTPLSWLIAGALAGRLELTKAEISQADEPDPVDKKTPGYSRPRPEHAPASARAHVPKARSEKQYSRTPVRPSQ
ncbi:hypothetical protein BCF46_3895 [Litoreibacter meonggei]|uniref:O-antigen ligase-like membrane protein n=1 Tax=Litoreibacter meonggei TaxID=1049199 RepID=A0A497V6Q8_9RHOB|nr:hypothetical protein [Litoreibacter meonggei]RLJ36205.1 hypothetical protein BCF46_3895 [Litoreibacter meonggei]